MEPAVLETLGDEIWTTGGPTIAVAGFRYPTRMVVIRLASGALFIWSPVALSAALRTNVDALGPVQYIVAPNTLHHLFIGGWQRAYPRAQTYAAPGLRARRQDITFDGELDNLAPSAWSSEIDQVILCGNWITTEVVFFHWESRTVLFADLMQQFDPAWFTGWRAVVAHWDSLTASVPSVPRKFRMSFIDRKAARLAVGQILAWPIERVVMAHAAPVRNDGHVIVKAAFEWLIR